MKKFLPFLLAFALTACNNGEKDDPDQPKPDAPKIMSETIVNTYPHDTSSFTQGLLIYNGELYEGTGNYGRSKLLKVDLKTGKALKEISLDRKYFECS